MTRTPPTLPILCGLALLVAAGVSRKAAAQEVYVEPVVRSYTAAHVPVGVALDELLGQFGLRYRVEGKLPQRSISVAVRHLPLSEALESVARTAGARVRVRREADTYVLEWQNALPVRSVPRPLPDSGSAPETLTPEAPTPGGGEPPLAMVFPVAGPTTWTDTWNLARGNGRRRHQGQDLMAPKMTPLVAVWDGVVTLSTSRSGHNTLRLHGDHGYMAWYMHINNDTPGTDDGLGTADYAFAPGLKTGDRVVAGQLLAWVGDSGNAEGTAPHCHFELHGPDGVFNAAPLLRAARKLDVPAGSAPTPNEDPEAGSGNEPRAALAAAPGLERAVRIRRRRDPVRRIPSRGAGRPSGARAAARPGGRADMPARRRAAASALPPTPPHSTSRSPSPGRGAADAR